MFTIGKTEASAADIYSLFNLYINKTSMTLYTNQPDMTLYGGTGHTILDKYSEKQYTAAEKKITDDLVWSTSNASVVQFVTNYIHYTDVDGTVTTTYDTAKKLSKSLGNYSGMVNLVGLSEGTATVTLKSKKLNSSVKCKVTVKNAEIKADNTSFYANNTYTFSMYGNTTAVSYRSSNTKVATIDEATGVMKTKKDGSTTISCLGENGKTYTYKVKVKKQGLNYKKLTTYYYTGLREGCYTAFPLVAEGIDVKSWKSSNKKVCKVNNYGSIGELQMTGTGKCTITCTAKNGKTYKCNLTVVGGKSWGGLNNGYRPTLSTLKKHGYYNDINKILDYGKVIVTILEYDHKIDLKNGNKKMTMQDSYDASKILAERYPGATIQSVGQGLGDYLLFTNDKKTKSGRIWVNCYYVE